MDMHARIISLSVCPSVCLMPLSFLLADHYRPSGLKCEIIIGAWCVCLLVCLSVCMFCALLLYLFLPSPACQMQCPLQLPENSGPCRFPTSQSITASRRSAHHCITTVCSSAGRTPPAVEFPSRVLAFAAAVLVDVSVDGVWDGREGSSAAPDCAHGDAGLSDDGEDVVQGVC
jgi:hypothetical protein